MTTQRLLGPAERQEASREPRRAVSKKLLSIKLLVVLFARAPRIGGSKCQWNF